MHHPNIVSIHDRGHTEDGTYCIVMEYMEGGTLEDLIEREGPLPPQRATEIAMQVAKALSVAHEKGVIHRDIKPQNILLSKSGEAKVADFGIARAATATTMTQAGSVMGTVHYISPEQALGETATPKSDLYSLGVVLYQMLTGELPYDAETPAGIIMKHVGGLSRSPKEANPQVPEELDAVTARLLSKDPENRYPDASALVEVLERVKEGLPPTAETMRARTRALRTRRLQRRGVLVALALVLISVGLIAAVALSRGGELFAETRTLPEPKAGQLTEPLLPGKYATSEFEPALSFSVSKDSEWRVSFPEASGVFALTPAESSIDPYPTLGFFHVTLVFSPEGQEAIRLGPNDPRMPAPDDVVAWLRNHPSLSTSEPVPVTVGGTPGVRLDVAVFPVPEDYSPSCKGQASDLVYAIAGRAKAPCVFVLGFADGGGLPLYAGGRYRLYVLEDVQGETVIIAASAPSREFPEFWPKAQEVLDTVEWEGAP